MIKKIYKGNIIGILKELADKDYQEKVWLYTALVPGMTISFTEAANMLFDDCVVGDYLKGGEVLFDKRTTQALRELHHATDAVDEYRPQEVIINDPLMEIVREKAAKALALIQASDGRESTVEIIE